MIFKQKTRREKTGAMKMRGKSISGRGISRCKGSEQDCVLCAFKEHQGGVSVEKPEEKGRLDQRDNET